MTSNVEDEASNVEDDEERERMVRAVRFVYHGRFTDEEVRHILEHVNWENKSAAVDFVQRSTTAEIRTVTGQSEDVITDLKTDPSVLDALQNGIKTETRQFACEDCDRIWWRKVPIRKEVSKCNVCKQKYEPVPREFEWGWASYLCEGCGHEFHGSGQKTTSAPCYQCDESVYPSDIKPPRPRNRGQKRSTNTHCCDAPDCTGHDPVPMHDVDPNRVYDDGTTNSSPAGSSRSVDTEDISSQVGQLQIGSQVRQNVVNAINKPEETLYSRNQPGQQNAGTTNATNGPGEMYSRNQQRQQNTRGTRRRGGFHTCVSPEARVGKKRVVYPSEKHISTGSTIGTFLSQSEQASTYAPSLSSIPERGRRRGGRGGFRY